MDIDFNNLRAETAYSLNRLINTLNKGRLFHNQHAYQWDNSGAGKMFSGDVLVRANDIARDLIELRSQVMALLSCYHPTDPDIVDVWLQVEKAGGIAQFDLEGD